MVTTQQIKHDYLNDFLYIESLNTLEDYLVRNDKLGMAHSMEGRFHIKQKIKRLCKSNTK